MAAIDTPWINSMATAVGSSDGSSSQISSKPPTIAAFSPASTINSSYYPGRRQTILVHQKSPLLLATPPQITRALAYSHPFLLPLNKLVGLLSWTTGDAWESFLLLAGFWGATLYGGVLIRWAGPILVVVFLVLLLYVRRFSPLSSAGVGTEPNSNSRLRSDSDVNKRHEKSLDQIVDNLRLFTSRCNVLLDPFIRLTDFLSTQSTATSSTLRPSLTTLFLRILAGSPIWLILTLPPLRLITTQRFVLIVGTFALSYHSQPARISRTILWRSRTVRRLCSAITGLNFSTDAVSNASSLYLQYVSTSGRRFSRDANGIAAMLAAAKNKNANGKAGSSDKESIRFTFTLYENQRRWVGIGWTAAMLLYERTAWTDDQLNAAPSKEKFTLPEVEGGFAKWQWCDESPWIVEGPAAEDEPMPTSPTKGKTSGSGANSASKGKDLTKSSKTTADPGGWIYFDNHWRFPQRQDGWGRYTRRRKWCRDAELVEVDNSAPARSKSSSSASTSLLQSPSPAKTTKEGSKVAATATGTHLSDRAAKLAAANLVTAAAASATSPTGAAVATSVEENASDGNPPLPERRPWFGRTRTNSKLSTTDDESAFSPEHEKVRKKKERDRDKDSSSGKSGSIVYSLERDEIVRRTEDGYVPMTHRGRQGAVEADWGIGEDIGMDLG